MKPPLQTMSVDTFVPMLRSLSKIFDKALQHAKAKSFDGAVLANARLAPDMFPLIRQFQIACDTAKNGTARLMGREAPKFEDNEQTLEQLKARIDRTIDYLEKADRGALQGAEDRQVTIPLPKDLVLEMQGLEYLRDWMLPHFYFHVVTAYDILRHNGVDIGKFDYLSHAGSAIRKRDELRKAG
jgi:uncharacterized protein